MKASDDDKKMQAVEIIQKSSALLNKQVLLDEVEGIDYKPVCLVVNETGNYEFMECTNAVAVLCDRSVSSMSLIWLYQRVICFV